MAETAKGHLMKDLRALLEKSEIVEQKSSLRTFIKVIEVEDSKVNIRYTLPLVEDGAVVEAVGVLPFIQNGSPNKPIDRTQAMVFRAVFACS